jgi:hypothetical protein
MNKWFLTGSAVCLVLTHAGCHSLPPKNQMSQENLKPHYILIDRDGFARNPNHEIMTTADLQNYVLDNIVSKLREGMQRIKECSPKPGCITPLKVLIFVHGGMNGYDQDFERMRRLLEQDETTRLPGLLSSGISDYFPIFINWNSDPLDSTVDDLFNIRFGKRQKSWQRLLTVPTAPFIILSRVLKSISTLLVSFIHLGYNVKEAYAGAIEAGDPHVCAIADGLLFVPFLPFYAISTPLLEGFGTPAWEIMKRRAELAVASRLPEDTENAQEGAARTLIRTLMQNSQLDEVGLEVTLVGHSMGSIVINRLLPFIEAKGNSSLKHIVYLAPAASIEDVNDYVIPYLFSHQNTHFSSFVLNRRDEAREVAIDGRIWFLPRGSLLAWIDTFFEPASTLHQETSGRVTNINTFFACDWQDRPLDDSCPNKFNTLIEDNGVVHFGYRERKFQSIATFPQGRMHLYEAVRPLNTQSGPHEHADFTKSRYLGQALCRIDENAFPYRVCRTSVEAYHPVEVKRPRLCDYRLTPRLEDFAGSNPIPSLR